MVRFIILNLKPMKKPDSNVANSQIFVQFYLKMKNTLMFNMPLPAPPVQNACNYLIKQLLILIYSILKQTHKTRANNFEYKILGQQGVNPYFAFFV